MRGPASASVAHTAVVQGASDDELALYLLQLVQVCDATRKLGGDAVTFGAQALRYEPHAEESRLATFLLDRALDNDALVRPSSCVRASMIATTSRRLAGYLAVLVLDGRERRHCAPEDIYAASIYVCIRTSALLQWTDAPTSPERSSAREWRTANDAMVVYAFRE